MLNTIAANMRTEELLKQSQSLTGELQSQQDRTAADQRGARRESAAALGAKRRGREAHARDRRSAPRARAKSRAARATSKYKSQFLANMSHELRTPLNSLLILSKTARRQPRGQPDGTAGRDGADDPARRHRPAHAYQRHPRPLEDRVGDDVGRHRRDVRSPISATTSSGRSAASRRSAASPSRSIVEGRCPADARDRPDAPMQILKNLLSNAFKFTAHGCVELKLSREPSVSSERVAARTIAFAVTDTGIGIAATNTTSIFEAFQQADMSTARKYGGTGLGLAISREIAGLLGGEMSVESRARSGQHVHVLPPAAARDARPTKIAPRRVIAPTVVCVAAPAPCASRPSSRRASGRSRRDRAARPHRADRRGRPDFRAHLARACARARVQGSCSRNRRARDSRWRAPSFPTRSRSTSACPTCDGLDLLDQLKRDPATRAIPVHVISGTRNGSARSRFGAFALLAEAGERRCAHRGLRQTPRRFATARPASVLVVEDDVTQLSAMASLIEGGEVDRDGGLDRCRSARAVSTKPIRLRRYSISASPIWTALP